MSKLKIGILGASRGMDFAMRILPGYKYAEIAAVCESYAPLLDKCRQFFREQGQSVVCCSSFDELLDSGSALELLDSGITLTLLELDSGMTA